MIVNQGFENTIFVEKSKLSLYVLNDLKDKSNYNIWLHFYHNKDKITRSITFCFFSFNL